MTRLATMALLALLLAGCSDTNNNGQPDTVQPEVRRAAGRTLDAAARQAAKAAGDARVAGGVRSRLGKDPTVRLYRVGVEADAGTVTLTGEVNTAKEKARVEELARQQDGVTTVRNRIQVRS